MYLQDFSSNFQYILRDSVCLRHTILSYLHIRQVAFPFSTVTAPLPVMNLYKLTSWYEYPVSQSMYLRTRFHFAFPEGEKSSSSELLLCVHLTTITEPKPVKVLNEQHSSGCAWSLKDAI